MKIFSPVLYWKTGQKFKRTDVVDSASKQRPPTILFWLQNFFFSHATNFQIPSASVQKCHYKTTKVFNDVDRWYHIFVTSLLITFTKNIGTRYAPKPSLKIRTASAIFWIYLGIFRDYGLKNIFLGIKLSASVWKSILWNLIKFQLNQTSKRKNVNNNCLN